MELEWDEVKRQGALAKRQIDFADVARIDPASIRTWVDERYAYGEQRLISYGYLDDRLCTFCWTQRGTKIRIISMRKANERERKRYEQGQDPRHA